MVTPPQTYTTTGGYMLSKPVPNMSMMNKCGKFTNQPFPISPQGSERTQYKGA